MALRDYVKCKRCGTTFAFDWFQEDEEIKKAPGVVIAQDDGPSDTFLSIGIGGDTIDVPRLIKVKCYKCNYINRLRILLMYDYQTRQYKSHEIYHR